MYAMTVSVSTDNTCYGYWHNYPKLKKNYLACGTSTLYFPGFLVLKPQSKVCNS